MRSAADPSDRGPLQSFADLRTQLQSIVWRNRCVKSVLFNVLLDGGVDHSGDRLPFGAALSDGS